MTVGVLMDRICRSADLIGLPHADPAGYYLVAAEFPGVRMDDDWPVASCSQSNKGSITVMLRVVCGGIRPAIYTSSCMAQELQHTTHLGERPESPAEHECGRSG